MNKQIYNVPTVKVMAANIQMVMASGNSSEGSPYSPVIIDDGNNEQW